MDKCQNGELNMNKLDFVLEMKIKIVCTTLMHFGDILVLRQLYRSFQ